MKGIGSETKKFPGIQALRALASSMVLFFHIFAISQFDKYSVVGKTKFLGIFSNYWAGVDLFFCISGFIIFHSYSNKKLQVSKFIAGRIIRIIPTYYLLTTLTIIWYKFEGNAAKISPTYLIQSFLLLVNLEERNPILAVGWSLQYEFLFYILFCFIYVRKRKHRFPLFSIGAFLFTLLPGIGPLFLEFLLGAAAFLVSDKLRDNPRVIRTLIFATLMCIGFELNFLNSSQVHSYRIFLLGIPFTLLVLLCSKLRSVNKIIILMGDISYSLYLTHTFSMTIIFRILEANKIQITLALFLLIICICYSTSYFFWKFAEIPITQSLKRKITS